MNNPPAFPTDTPNGRDMGMTLRDYFAAAALTGICASDACSSANPTFKDVAAKAFAQADEMLKERNQDGGSTE